MNKIVMNNCIKKIIISVLILLLCNFIMPVYTYALANGGTLNKYIVPITLMIPDLLLNKLQNIFVGKDVEYTNKSTGEEYSIKLNEDGKTATIMGTIKRDDNGNVTEINKSTTQTTVKLKDLNEVLTNRPVDIAQLDPKDGVSNYVIMYSPAVIFSGQVAGLDINFISPMGLENEGKVYKNWISYTYELIEEEIDYEGEDGEKDLKNTYGYDIEKVVSGIHNSDAETYVFWFRRRGWIYNLGI